MTDKIVVVDETEDIINHTRSVYYTWYSVILASLIALVMLWFQINEPLYLKLLITIIVLMVLYLIYYLIIEKIIKPILYVEEYKDIKFKKFKIEDKNKLIRVPIYKNPFTAIILPCRIANSEILFELMEEIRRGLERALDQCEVFYLSRNYYEFSFLFSSPSSQEKLKKLSDNTLEIIEIRMESGAIKTGGLRLKVPLWGFPCIKNHNYTYLNIDVITIFPKNQNNTFINIYAYLNDEALNELDRCISFAIFPLFYYKLDLFFRELKHYVEIVKDNLIYEIEQRIHRLCAVS